MHFSVQRVCTRIINISTLIEINSNIRKQLFENLVRGMSKSQMLKVLLKPELLVTLLHDLEDKES